MRRRPERTRGRPHSPTPAGGCLVEAASLTERLGLFGHWEGDLLFRRGMSSRAILVERSTPFLMLVDLPDSHQGELAGMR